MSYKLAKDNTRTRSRFDAIEKRLGYFDERIDDLEETYIKLLKDLSYKLAEYDARLNDIYKGYMT